MIILGGLMAEKEYTAPAIEYVASFQEATKGLWFGNYVDSFGGKAPIPLGVL